MSLVMRELIQGARKLGLELSAGQVRRFELYFEELVKWNRRINLTAITDPSGVQVKHFLDSLTVVQALPREELARPGFSVVDIGTGAGFPGVPLKIVFPQLRLVLVEATAKKTAFLSHIVEELGLENVEVVNSRAEEAARSPLYREQFPFVLSRAVAPLPALVELTLPFCVVGGRFVAQKKGDISEELDGAKSAITVLGGRLGGVKRIELEEFPDERYLVLVDKISPTPEEYPRRAGVALRRPIRRGRS